MKKVDYRVISPEPELEQFRRARAREAERAAMFSELEAEQWAAALAATPDRPELRPQATYFEENAEKLRAQANDVHALAGTSPADFTEELSTELRTRLEGMERQHLQAAELAENAETYREDERGHRWNAELVAAGLEIAREKLDELKPTTAETLGAPGGPVTPGMAPRP